MTLPQQIVTIGLCVLATVLTRFLPFLVFSGDRPTPAYVQFLGKALPGAIFSMLVVYCLRSTTLTQFPFGLPEALAIGLTVLLHLWRRQTLLSIAGGTVFYMLLIQFCF